MLFRSDVENAFAGSGAEKRTGGVNGKAVPKCLQRKAVGTETDARVGKQFFHCLVGGRTGFGTKDYFRIAPVSGNYLVFVAEPAFKIGRYDGNAQDVGDKVFVFHPGEGDDRAVFDFVFGDGGQHCFGAGRTGCDY